MSFQSVCPGCQTSFTLKDEQRGKKIRCKKCEEIFVAAPARRPKNEDDDEKVATRPAASGTRSGSRNAPARGRRGDDEDEKPRRKDRKSDKGNNTALIVAVSGVSVVLIAAVAVVAIILTRPGKPASNGVNAGLQTQPISQIPLL